MIVGSLLVELYIPGIRSLKEKRAVLNRLKQRLKNKFNISVSEVSHQELLQRSGIGISAICARQADLEGLFNSIHDMINGFFAVQVLHMEKDVYN